MAEAEKAAAESSPAEDAQPLLGPADRLAFGSKAGPQPGQPAWDDPPGRTEIGVLRGFAGALGEAFGTAAAGGQKLYGYAEHSLTSLFLGTSSGLRLRHDQPTGKVELNAKSADLARSAWAGQATRDFTDVDVAALERRPGRRLGWAARRVELPAGQIRDAAAADRRRRPAHLPVLVHRGKGRSGRPDGVQQARRRDQGRGAARQPAGDAAQRPGRRRACSARRS